MDCTPFFRTRWQLTAWIVGPLLLAISMTLSANGFHNRQRYVFEKNRALSNLVPEMETETKIARRFLETYRLNDAEKNAAQDMYIRLMNTAAQDSGLTIGSIYLDEENLNYELNTARITIHIEASGTSRQIAEFFKQLNEQSPMLFINKLTINPSGRASDQLKVNAELVNVYVK